MSVHSIPQFVSHKTPEGLQLEIISFQSNTNLSVSVQTICFANGMWYAWFNIPLTRFRNRDGKADK